jgi:hypothetical protein
MTVRPRMFLVDAPGNRGQGGEGGLLRGYWMMVVSALRQMETVPLLSLLSPPHCAATARSRLRSQTEVFRASA